MRWHIKKETELREAMVLKRKKRMLWTMNPLNSRTVVFPSESLERILNHNAGTQSAFPVKCSPGYTLRMTGLKIKQLRELWL